MRAVPHACILKTAAEDTMEPNLLKYIETDWRYSPPAIAEKMTYVVYQTQWTIRRQDKAADNDDASVASPSCNDFCTQITQSTLCQQVSR
jgi:hypothetical protein